MNFITIKKFLTGMNINIKIHKHSGVQHESDDDICKDGRLDFGWVKFNVYFWDDGVKDDKGDACSCESC